MWEIEIQICQGTSSSTFVVEKISQTLTLDVMTNWVVIVIISPPSKLTGTRTEFSVQGTKIAGCALLTVGLFHTGSPVSVTTAGPSSSSMNTVFGWLLNIQATVGAKMVLFSI